MRRTPLFDHTRLANKDKSMLRKGCLHHVNSEFRVVPWTRKRQNLQNGPKSMPRLICHNFVKYCWTFKIISLAHLAVNSQPAIKEY